MERDTRDAIMLAIMLLAVFWLTVMGGLEVVYGLVGL
jgi:hypothetical protein